MLVTLMIDEIYTAQRIENSNESFVGLTEKGASAKTVLTFIIRFAFSKYKDVLACYQLVNWTQLCCGMVEKVMLALDDLFFVITVSVDNHICDRNIFYYY